MNYKDKFNKLSDLVDKDIYVNKTRAQNILFLGGCRSYVYSIFFEEICNYNLYLKNAQFGTSVIGVHTIAFNKTEKTQNIKSTIENADIIVCEQIRNYNFLNTSKNCDQNIFNNFSLKENCKIVNVPNLECNYYHINDEVTKLGNLKNLTDHCKKYNFEKLSNFILDNINKTQLFVTFNHPSNVLFCEFIKELMENHFNLKLQSPMLNILSNIKIFD
jgi:hypothetical protein